LLGDGSERPDSLEEAALERPEEEGGMMMAEAEGEEAPSLEEVVAAAVGTTFRIPGDVGA
jgi:hypothetical protein